MKSYHEIAYDVEGHLRTECTIKPTRGRAYLFPRHATANILVQRIEALRTSGVITYRIYERLCHTGVNEDLDPLGRTAGS